MFTVLHLQSVNDAEKKNNKNALMILFNSTYIVPVGKKTEILK